MSENESQNNNRKSNSENNSKNDEIQTKKLDDKTSEEKQDEALTPEEKKARRKKIIRTSIIVLIIIGLTIGVSFFGPANMTPGEYQVTLTIDTPSDTFSVNFNITMAEQANIENIEYYLPSGSENTNCVIIAQQAYQASTNSKIEFRVGLIDSTNSSIESIELSYITGRIVGKDIDRKIRPTKIEDTYSRTLEDELTTAYFSMAVPFKAGIALGLLVLIAGLWISEIVPTIIGSFIVPIAVVVFGISNAGAALSSFFEPVIALFFGGFILAEALKKHNIDRRLALGIISNASIKPPILLLLMMGLSAFMSMWMSNTASAAVMVPIAIAMVDQIESGGKSSNNKRGGFKKALVLGIGYAATTGGIASIIGTPANPIAVAGLEKVGINISFLKWFAYGLPFVFIMLIIIWGYLLVVFKPKVPKEKLEKAKIVFQDDLKNMGKMQWKEWATISVFLITIGLWLTSQWHGISSGIIALVAVVLIFAMGILDPKDVKKINWNALFLFGGGLSLGEALIATGIGDWIASNMGIIEGKHYILIALIVGGISLIVTAVASNTASAAMLVPLVIPIAFSLGIDPILLALVTAIGSSVDYALVFGTPPTMISYSTGYFKVKEIFRIGFILDLIGIALLSTVSVLLWALFGIISV
ncbi:MAG: DASS family sodium-coupled anion symporter [Asgard group archaeon]|nr:DASS family sodium-coupled anion symporter [Asgard group archaeon]